MVLFAFGGIAMQGDEVLFAGLKGINSRKPYGPVLFGHLARLMPTVAVEAVCLRFSSSTSGFEVYMVQRPPDEPDWPNQWHCPGSVFRTGEAVSDVLDRLAKKEFGKKILSARFAGFVNLPNLTRGHCVSLVHLCIVDWQSSTAPLTGNWFSVDNLPENTMDCHRDEIVPVAVAAFNQRPV